MNEPHLPLLHFLSRPGPCKHPYDADKEPYWKEVLYKELLGAWPGTCAAAALLLGYLCHTQRGASQ